ncbi:MAG: SpoIID/LytB domain-containing protein [Candidatus Gastranaerophilales bacterium]|nr:SpoIID/LytB domain-containing protein [Candidatus Gastranaerophilales bacterium]
MSTKAEAVKVGLITDASQTYIASSNKAQLINARTNHLAYTLSPMKVYFLKAHGNTILMNVNGQYYDLGTDSVVLKTDNTGFLSTKKRWYRGEFIINNRNNNLTLINYLPLEEYLMGVVPSEMPSKWNAEALKAQAIAARSYAIANRGKRASLGFDLKDNTEDQAYGGATSETTKTNEAVLSTKGIVVTYNKQVIPAYYHASAGGQTSNSGGQWAHNLPYLRSVPSYDDGIKKMGHGIGMSQYGANNLAQQGYNAYQILTYFYNNIKFGRLTPGWNF